MAEERYYATGKRKSAIARVWMKLGEGNIVINKSPIDDYLVTEIAKMIVAQPLELTNTVGRYDITVNVKGGGISGQVGAIRHGISQALLKISPEYREPLKKAGFLTRDSRIKERKKYGLRSARARFQYSKR
ncbi:MAG: 30S ribosomal protein S9 [Deltaproteobacteria bacterium]|nr:30S ribosomal protein S9 [Deltaproteobacteria bacterium]OQY17514.1 MAG: 30S ribosomal protein S9 [Desulfobacterium sp. 4572_20]HDH87661.1 30S ribosomal protein S9 [Desulfobacteraceae bacterium]MBW2332024.1 30S ribosomal protein S9 [Deltaproteobacteria bacterium]MCD6264360.1 30S ribosomal protein S9 [Deltaproteobacteria bacterium]